MKKTMIMSVMIIIVSMFLSGEISISEQFKRANDLYKKNAYAEALTVYNKIIAKEGDWKIYFNIANCHYRLKDFVKAKIFYLKAKRLKKTDDDIDKNIKIVNKSFKDIIPERESEFFSNTLSKIESIISLNILAIIIIIFVCLFNLILFLQLKKRKEGIKKYFSYSLVFIFIISIITVSYFSYRFNQNNKRIIGVVLKDNTSLRSGKDSASNAIIINAGLDFKIIEEDENWIRIRVSNEIEGWVNKKDVEII